MKNLKLYICLSIFFLFTIKIHSQQSKYKAVKNIKSISSFKPAYDGIFKTLKQGENKDLHENGKTKYLYTVDKYNKVQGSVKEFYKSGKIKLEGNYLDGKKEGNQKTYFKTGKLESVSNFSEGELTGENIIYFENGKINERHNLKKVNNSITIEKVEKYYLSLKEKKKIGSFEKVDGKLVRKVSTRVIPEKYTQIAEYNYKNNYLEGKQKEHFKNGTIKNSYIYKKGEIQNKTEYNPVGKLYKTTTYNHEKYKELRQSYHSNGKIKNSYELSYEGSAIDILYYKNGKEKKISKIDNELYLREVMEFFENGTRKGGGKLNKKGKPIGKWETFYENGNKESFQNFDEVGNSIGEWKTYYKNGKKKCYNEIIKDTQKNLCFYENGQPESQYNYKNDLINGVQKDFFENGNLKSEENYKSGKKDGKFKVYYSNKQIHQTYIWKNDKLMNIKNCYDKNGKKLDKGTLKNGNGTVKYYDEDGELKITKVYTDGKHSDSY